MQMLLEQESGILDCLFPGLGGFRHVLQLLNHQFLAVLF
jgi:hypothetical protein